MAVALAAWTDAPAVAARTLHIKIRRSEQGAAEAFDVLATDPVTVLDLLRSVQQYHDPTLAFRYSCRVAMCGTCTLRLDGPCNVLACQTPKCQPTR